MTDLEAVTPCAGLLPQRVGELTIRESAGSEMTLIAPYPGKEAAVREQLPELPEPGRWGRGEHCEIMWFGRQQWLIVGEVPDVDLTDLAALTDQSEAWAVVDLYGPGWRAVLARLVPVDLRPSRFSSGTCLRTEVQHMPAAVIARDGDGVRLMVFRSMAQTLVHDLLQSMRSQVARTR